MTHEEKKQIVEQIEDYMSSKGYSQNAMARDIKISPAHLINIRNEEKWEAVGEQTWRRVQNYFKPASGGKWNILTVGNYQLVHEACRDAQTNSRMITVYGETGFGKTTGFERYARTNKNVYYVLCNFLMTKKTFLKAIAASMGIEAVSNTEAMLNEITNTLNKIESPELILDDAGKLQDSNYRLIQLIYDATEGRAAIILGGTTYLKKHIKDMVERDKMGFRELNRRIEYWQELHTIDYLEVVAVCEANGLSGGDVTKYIWRKCKNFGSIKEMIINAKRMANGDEITVELLDQLHVN